MNKVIPVILGLWLLSLPFKNAVFELSSAFLIGLTAAHILWSGFRAPGIELPALPASLGLGLIAVVASMTLSNWAGRQSPDGYWIPAHFFVRYGGTFACLYYLYFRGFFKKHHLYTWFMVSLTVQALMGIQQSFDHYDWLRDREIIHGNRVYGGTFNPNTFGLLMAIGASICSWQIMHFRQLPRVRVCLYGVLLLAIGYGLILSGSRSAWLSYLVFLCLSVWFSAQVRLKHAILGGVLISVGITCLMLYSDQAAQLLKRAVLMDSSNRVDIWRSAWAYFVNSPWLGYGSGNYDVLSNTPFSSIHNSLLEILVFTGILGLFAYGILGYGVSQLIRRSGSTFLAALTISIAITSLFDHSIFDSKIYLSVFVILVFLLAINRRAATGTPTQEPA